MKKSLLIIMLAALKIEKAMPADVVPLPAATKKQMQAQAENAAVKKQTRAKTEFDNLETAKARALMVYGPRPQYPYEARARHITGSGVAIVNVNPRTGVVTKAFIARSTGSPILDNAAISAFRFWIYQPNTVSKVNIPFHYTMSGAHY